MIKTNTATSLNGHRAWEMQKVGNFVIVLTSQRTQTKIDGHDITRWYHLVGPPLYRTSDFDWNFISAHCDPTTPIVGLIEKTKFSAPSQRDGFPIKKGLPLLRRTQVWFLAPPRWLTTHWNSSSRKAHSLFRLLWDPTWTCAHWLKWIYTDTHECLKASPESQKSKYVSEVVQDMYDMQKERGLRLTTGKLKKQTNNNKPRCFF